MKKSRWKKPADETSQDMSLNIASMADIFVVLLVFLLKSAAGSGAGVQPSAPLTLPTGKGGDEMIEALRLEIASSIIMVDSKPAVELNNFQLKPNDLESEIKITPLITKLNEAKSRQLASINFNKTEDGKKLEALKLTVMIDQDTPYSLIKQVLASSAGVGYSSFKLVVLKEQE